MSREDGGPAFPIPLNEGEPWSGQMGPADGMTLRDYFAAKASDADVEDQAQKLWAARCDLGIQIRVHRPINWRQIARFAHADAMLAARKENTR